MRQLSTIPFLLLIIALSFLIEAKFASQQIFPIHGNWINNDHMLVIPAVYYLSGQGYFQNDFGISEYVKAYPTLLFNLMAAVYNLIGNMQISYFTLFLLLKIIFVLSTFLLARLLLKNDKLALLATLALAFTHFMGAEEIGVSEVVAKGFVFSFVPLLFYLFFKDRKKFSVPVSISLGMLAYFHVISALPVLLALLTLLAWQKEWKILAISILAFATISAPFFIGVMEVGGIDIASLKLIEPYSTLEGGGKAVLKYFPLIIIGLFAAAKKEKKVLVLMSAISAYSSLSLLLLFSDAFLPYNFFRAARFVIFFSFIYATYAIFSMWKVRTEIKVLAFLLIWIPFSSINYSNIFPFPIQSPQSNSDVVQIGNWLDLHTDKDSIVLSPPDLLSLRIWSKRAVVFSEGDFWVGSVRPDVKAEIMQRYTDIEAAYGNFSDASLTTVAKRYGASYILTYSTEMGTKPVFSSGLFRIYSLYP